MTYRSDFEHLYTEEFKRVFHGMEVRAQFAKEHARRIQALYKKWREAHDSDSPITWQDMIDALEGTIDFVTENKKMFPNWRHHIDIWNFLISIAEHHLDYNTIITTTEEVEEVMDFPGYYEGVLHSKPVR